MIKAFAIAAAASLILPVAGMTQQVQRPLASGWRILVEYAPPTRPALITGSLPPTERTTPGHLMSGIASYYWQEQMTSSGERFDKNALTAAHRTLPMHTRVKVTSLVSGRSVVVRINDRGPFKPGRVVDLSDRAAEILGFKPRGLAQVRMEVVQ